MVRCGLTVDKKPLKNHLGFEGIHPPSLLEMAEPDGCRR